MSRGPPELLAGKLSWAFSAIRQTTDEAHAVSREAAAWQSMVVVSAQLRCCLYLEDILIDVLLLDDVLELLGGQRLLGHLHELGGQCSAL